MAAQLCWVDEEGVPISLYKPSIERKVKGEFIMVIQAAIEALISKKGINGTEYRVLWYLLSQMDFEGKVLTSQASIAKRLEITSNMVSQAIATLKGLHFIMPIEVNGLPGFEINPQFAQKGSKRAVKIKTE